MRTIWACDHDIASGALSNRRVFVDTHGLAGRPDGGAVDADGCYWMAGVGGWQLVRFTPDGEVDLIVDVPVEKPTKVAFGGPGLDTLYFTSIGPGSTAGTRGAAAAGRRDLRDPGAGRQRVCPAALRGLSGTRWLHLLGAQRRSCLDVRDRRS